MKKKSPLSKIQIFCSIISFCFLAPLFFLITMMLPNKFLIGSDSNLDQRDQDQITVCPIEYPHGLCNPLKGFRCDTGRNSFKHEFCTITRCYIKWSDIENKESDTIEKIKEYCDRKWKDLEKYNIKVIPRVYLDWNRKPGNEYWPADMKTGDYSSDQFKKRVVRLIARLGECWDNDPRVAWIQMGLIGCWGEHHTPSPDLEMQKLLGDAFTKAFKNKKILVRHSDEFTAFPFGIYWDSWAHYQQSFHKKHGGGIDDLNRAKKRWQIAPIEGEIAYDWGKFRIQPGDHPNDTLSDPVHRDFLIDLIRRLHCSGLGWVANYDPTIPEVHQGADEVQKAFGYRFVLNRFSVPRRMDPGKTAIVKFSVINTGSTPFYEKWPVEFALLDPKTHKPVWKSVLSDVDIRKWLPGDDWDDEKNRYRSPAQMNTEERELMIPESLNKGEYIAALAVLEPIGHLPNLRFAIRNYFNGGYHPLCMVAVGSDPSGNGQLDPHQFDDPGKDRRLPYSLLSDTQVFPR